MFHVVSIGVKIPCFEGVSSSHKVLTSAMRCRRISVRKVETTVETGDSDMANLHSRKLTAKFVERATKPGKYTDGHGLMLWIQPTGSRQWVQRLQIQGKRREMGLGGFPLVTLESARETALANRRIARSGGDPRSQSTAANVPTFAEASRTVHAIHAPSWRNAKQRQQWIDEVARIVHPAIGHLPVDAITTGQLTAVFEPIWLTKPVIANRVRQRTEKILDWAVSQGYRPDNPAGSPLKANLPKQPKGDHHTALPHREVAGAIQAVRDSTSGEMAKLVFEFMVLTATRKSETLEARWSEIDLEARTWSIPASRMKAGREHRIPLSNAAMALLGRARGLCPVNRSGLVFESPRGKALDGNTLNKMMAKIKVKASPHGFRSSFRDWCSETEKPGELAEAALAHVNSNATEAAYARSDLFDRRRGLMQEWAEYVSA